MKGHNGVFHTPNYPNNFDPGDACNWVITVDKNHLVKLTFEDVAIPKYFKCFNFIKVIIFHVQSHNIKRQGTI